MSEGAFESVQKFVEFDVFMNDVKSYRCSPSSNGCKMTSLLMFREDKIS